MLEIRTIIVNSSLPGKFDTEVNNHIKEGWELVRRDVLPPYEGECMTCPQRLYAELERDVDAPETDDDDDEDDTETAEWEITRDPAKPYRCSKCGYKITSPWPTCPNCLRHMEKVDRDDES